MVNRIVLNETSYHGAGAIQEIATEVTKRGFKKAFVCSDPDLVKFGVTKKVTDVLDNAGLAYEVYSQIKPNPTIENVQTGVAAFKAAGADYLIAIGGGSPQDTCKAIGIISNNPEFADVRSLEGLSPTNKPSVPILAIPTTAGTAAEVTINYVITDEEKRRKFVCVDPHDIPQVAFIDADMMDGMPPALKAATGVDALAVAIGSAHGFYKQPPKLDIERLKAIHAATDVVLVLHGSSGIPHPMVQEAIANGIAKVNLATEIKDTFMRALKQRLADSDEIDLRKVFPKAVAPVVALLEEKYRMTGSATR